MSGMRKVFAKEAWYAAGLAFECTGCGRCCAGPQEGYVWISEEQIAEIAEYLGVPETEMRGKYVRRIARRYSLVERADNKDCIFLTDSGETRSCRIYPVRPTQCRTWPFWPSNLGSPDQWATAGLRCGGINRGRIHSCDEIEAKRRATRS
jgi:Fe-S-cluster containining protein